MNENTALVAVEKPKRLGSNLNASSAKNFIRSLIPPGKVFEKFYILIIVAGFTAFLFKPGAFIDESKLLLFIGALGGLFLLRMIRGKLSIPQGFVLGYGVFLLICLITAFTGIYVYNSINYLLIAFAAGLATILGFDVVYGRLTRRWILNVFTFVLTLAFSYSLYLYAFSSQTATGSVAQTSIVFPLAIPIYNALLILAVFPFVLSSYIRSSSVKKFFYLFSIIIFSLSIYFTFSKAAYIGFGLEIFSVLVFYIKNHRRNLLDINNLFPLVLSVILMIFLCVHWTFASSGTVPFNANAFADRNLTLPLRSEIYRQAWNTFKSHPILGIGLGNFRFYSLYLQSKPWMLSYYTYDILLNILDSTGIVGLIVFVGFLIYIIRLLFTHAIFTTITSNKYSDGFEILVGFLVLLAASLLYPVESLIPVLFLLFFFMGILLRIYKAKKIKYNYKNYSTALTSFTILGVIVALYFFVINFEFVQTESQLQSNSSAATISSKENTLLSLQKYNPFDADYAVVVAQIYLSKQTKQGYNDGLAVLNNTQKFDRLDPDLFYLKNISLYYLGEKNQVIADTTSLLKKSPYINPQMYILPAQIYKDEGNTKRFTSYLKLVTTKFPINNDFKRYQELFTDLGYANTLYQVQLQLLYAGQGAQSAPQSSK